MKKVKCILLIDDSAADNEFHRRAIVKANVCEHIEIATGGEKALDYLQNCGLNGKPSPDMMFVDINMPGMNGFEFLEEYKKLDDKLKSKIVVFMLSSSIITSDREKAEEFGNLSDFLNKPLTTATVTDIVEKYF